MNRKPHVFKWSVWLPQDNGKFIPDSQYVFAFFVAIRNLFFKEIPLHEKCPNTKFFLVRTFLFSDWIRRFTPQISVFSANTGKHGPEKNSVFGHFSSSVQWKADDGDDENYDNNHRRCSIKKGFLKFLQNSQENACARVSFLLKLQALATLGLQLY